MTTTPTDTPPEAAALDLERLYVEAKALVNSCIRIHGEITDADRLDVLFGLLLAEVRAARRDAESQGSRASGDVAQEGALTAATKAYWLLTGGLEGEFDQADTTRDRALCAEVIRAYLAALPAHRQSPGAAMAHVLKGTLASNGVLTADDLDRVAELIDAPREPITDADREWAQRAALAQSRQREDTT